MKAVFLIALLCLCVLLPVYLYRAIAGPTVFDRLIGLNAIATKSILFLVLIGALTGQTGAFIDICLGYGLLNLVGALATGKFLEHKESLV